MSDMSQVIIPKSDQMNADDLIAGPITVKITGVTIRPGTEQPISIHYDGDNGKPYKACKSMCRVMVTAWGPDSKKYTGRSMTLFREPTVKWGGMEVGGIRISHMSDIESAITMALTMTRANKRPYTVKPLTQSAPPASAPAGTPSAVTQDAQAGADTISPDQAIELSDLCSDAKMPEAKFLKMAGVSSFDRILLADYAEAKASLLAKIAEKTA